jgi:hypothetical protein
MQVSLINFYLWNSNLEKTQFKVLSFPKYLSENMEKLSLTDSSSGTVTLHEAYKSAYKELDLHGPRDVLQQLSGVQLL